jgi:murein L,D-transpeptidase YcbB/YkuD
VRIQDALLGLSRLMRCAPLFSTILLAMFAGVAPAIADSANDRRILSDELARLTADPKADMVSVPDGKTIHPGDKNPAIPAIRSALQAYGFVASDAAPADPQLYDDPMAGQVRRFQQVVGLAPDAMIGGETRKALRGMDADRVLMLQQSLAQPSLPSKGRYIEVNLAAATISAVEDGKIVLQSAAVIGRKENQTPLISARIDAVWLNPSWIVPESIVEKEFGGNAHTEKPGPANPLGQLLLEMPNKDEIFIHSTNEPGLFERDVRAFSHGCVRVKEIEAFARWVLGDDRWAAEKIDAGLGHLASRRFALDQTIPVYIGYRTATVGPRGIVIYHPDPYGLALPAPPAADTDPNAALVESLATGAHPTPN